MIGRVEGDNARIHIEEFRRLASWRGAVENIRPRAEQRDGQQVFVAEVSLDNTASQLRPGMSGVARITSRSQPIGWILFHRPLEALIRLWGW